MMRNTTRYTCQPIANLESRKREYWAEVRSVLGVLGLIALIAVFACIAAVKYLATPWSTAALVCSLVMALPIKMFWPDYPTAHDVEIDRALRRDAGLPDDVEPD